MKKFNDSAVWLLKKDGVFANSLKGEKYEYELFHIAFESVAPKGITLKSVLDLAFKDSTLMKLFDSTGSLSNLKEYMDYIDWDKNKGLFYSKFPAQYTPQNSYLLISPNIYQKGKEVVNEGLFNFDCVTTSTGTLETKSVFGVRLEDLLDLPIKYDPEVLIGDNHYYEPLTIIKLFQVLSHQVFSLMEGSKDVNSQHKYL